MKILLVLALVLLGAAAEFFVVGRPALDRERQAHADLLAREKSVKSMEARLPPTLSEELGALLAERDRLAQLAQRRLVLLTGDGQAPDRPAPTLEALLDARSDQLLAAETRLGTAVREQAAASPQAHEALALLVRALGECKGVEALELAKSGAPAPVPDVPQLVQLQATIVVSSSVSDVLGVLERLSPSPSVGLPFAGVVSMSLRRIEPDRWGTGLQLLDTPPVRLTATVAIYFPSGAGGGA